MYYLPESQEQTVYPIPFAKVIQILPHPFPGSSRKTPMEKAENLPTTLKFL